MQWIEFQDLKNLLPTEKKAISPQVIFKDKVAEKERPLVTPSNTITKTYQLATPKQISNRTDSNGEIMTQVDSPTKKIINESSQRKTQNLSEIINKFFKDHWKAMLIGAGVTLLVLLALATAPLWLPYVAGGAVATAITALIIKGITIAAPYIAAGISKLVLLIAPSVNLAALATATKVVGMTISSIPTLIAGSAIGVGLSKAKNWVKNKLFGEKKGDVVSDNKKLNSSNNDDNDNDTSDLRKGVQPNPVQSLPSVKPQPSTYNDELHKLQIDSETAKKSLSESKTELLDDTKPQPKLEEQENLNKDIPQKDSSGEEQKEETQEEVLNT